jgi:hypothetical protein
MSLSKALQESERDGEMVVKRERERERVRVRESEREESGRETENILRLTLSSHRGHRTSVELIERCLADIL